MKYNELELQEIAEFKNGKKRPDSKGKIPVYGGNGILDYTDEYNAEKGSIIIGRVGAYCGSVYKTFDKCWISDNAIMCKNKGNNDFLYLYYLLKKINLNRLHIGSSQPLLTQNILNSIKVVVPENEIQYKIGYILSKIDDKIELNNKINENLQYISQILFKHWFIDFEFLNEEGLSYKSSGGEMINSELGMIPNGWEVKQLKEVNKMGTLIMGQSPSGSSYNQDRIGIPLINGAADIKDGNLVPNKYTTEPKKISKINDFIFCIRATIGLLTISDGEYCLGRGVACITEIEDIYYEYMYQEIDNSFKKFEKTAGGSVYINLSKDDFNNMKLIIPNEKILKKYHSICAPILKLIMSNKKQILELINLRDTILPKLMNGEIDLSNIEINQ